MSSAAFDPWLRAQACAFFLALVRISAMLVTAPLPWSTAPSRTRVILALLLTVCAYDRSPEWEALGANVLRSAASVGGEFMLGAAIGLVVRTTVAAVEIAADQMATSMGLGAAQMFDPEMHATSNVLSQILRYLAMFVAVSVGFHRLVLLATIQSFKIIPAGSVLAPESFAPSLSTLVSTALSTGVRLAMPIVAVLFMTQVALAFISRAAPAMQVFSVGFAVTLGVGGLVLLMALPDFTFELVADMSQLESRLSVLFSNLLPRAAPP
ncbi:MAG TPA: flagellar biosynthetic protein FliR [Polyangiaceae bacterium]|nr:flagellar biosynthetic protein FliR [Polyangiaceae bacterium]